MENFAFSLQLNPIPTKVWNPCINQGGRVKLFQSLNVKYNMLYIFGKLFGSKEITYKEICTFAKTSAIFCVVSLYSKKMSEFFFYQNMTCYTFSENPWHSQLECAKFSTISEIIKKNQKYAFLLLWICENPSIGSESNQGLCVLCKNAWNQSVGLEAQAVALEPRYFT